jgi:LEA14-like dessication related protein
MLLALLLLLTAPQASAAAAAIEPGPDGTSFTIVLPEAAGEPSGRVKVELTQYELTGLSESRTEGRAVLAISNPFKSAILVSAPKYTMRVNGQDFGTGAARERKIRAKKRSALELPFHGKKKIFEDAAGSTWVQGAWVPADIVGDLTLQINGKTVPVEFKLSYRMGTEGARSGVFSNPLGR